MISARTSVLLITVERSLQVARTRFIRCWVTIRSIFHCMHHIKYANTYRWQTLSGNFEAALDLRTSRGLVSTHSAHRRSLRMCAEIVGRYGAGVAAVTLRTSFSTSSHRTMVHMARWWRALLAARQAPGPPLWASSMRAVCTAPGRK